jgi:hypothetical protein
MPRIRVRYQRVTDMTDAPLSDAPPGGGVIFSNYGLQVITVFSIY